MRKWTPYETEFLRENYLEMTDKEIGREIGRTSQAVRSKRNELKLMKKTNPKWTSKEKELLKNYVEEGLTNVEISRLLGRGYRTISKVKRELGLSESRGQIRRWTEEEENSLAKMYYEGYNDKEIANVLRRTERAVKARRGELRLVSRENKGSRYQNIYAVYEGEKFLAEGTLLEISDELGVSFSTIKWYEWASKNNMSETTVIKIS